MRGSEGGYRLAADISYAAGEVESPSEGDQGERVATAQCVQRSQRAASANVCVKEGRGLL